MADSRRAPRRTPRSIGGTVVTEAHLVAVPRHPGHAVAEAAPRVEAAVQELELRRARLEGEEAEGGAKDSGAMLRTDALSLTVTIRTVTAKTRRRATRRE